MRATLGTVLLLALAWTGARGQTLPPTLHVRGVGEPVAVDVATHRGYPAYPAWMLRSLGARVDATLEGGVVVFGTDTLRFTAGSPFFHASGRAWQLVNAPYRERGILHLPHQLFAEWLPRAYPDQLSYERGRLRLVGEAGPRAEPEPEAPGQDALTPLVIIDPGHGGPDEGAVGPSGVREKDIVLQVSKRLARVLTERGYDIRMTRTGDTLIALEDRPHLANEWRGNRPALFLSIHANWVRDRGVRGFETFFLSDARTEDERRVAEMENAAVEYETETRVVDTDELGFIRNNLRNDFYVRASYDLAGLVQSELGDFHRGADRGVKQAGFIVLIGAFMPAVLVELAFISNPAEERMLGSGSFQLELARGIADAVDRFFERQGERWTGSFP
jgi:N-acetylmuramoyl-L-alanine amidase